MFFTSEEIQSHAFEAVVEDGKRCYKKGRVSSMQFIGNDIIGAVRIDRLYRVIVSRHSESKITFDCSCGFAYGGACEHVVAVMLAANGDQAIQVGIDWDAPVSESVTNTTQQANSASNQVQTAINSEQEPEVQKNVHNDQAELIEVPSEKPIGRLYLDERDNMLFVELRFAYSNGAVEFTRYDGSSSRLVPSGEGVIYRINRSKARETAMTSSLVNFDLMQYQVGVYTPVCDPRIWVLQELPRLGKSGFEIYGEENLRTTHARKSAPRMGLSISTNNNIYDCDVQVSFDGIPARLAALIYAVRQQSRFVLLTDDTSGELPQSWLEKLAALFSLLENEPDNNHIHVQPTHAALVDLLYDLAETPESERTHMEQRKKLQNFTGLASCSAPDGFAGTMRPYQQAGYEWFYFLKEYHFGGCLADDMGLGKTVQTVALLLREKQLSEPTPSLVVVPTSLLFNWQREITKFAPLLSVLPYHGPTRHRNEGVFSMTDVIITSYGTLARDIELLKTKKFHYIILDEAHIIKNPSSQAGRALRQLNSNYRLALSGTPIENSLSELWSLFSFLNPGILGSFRSFAKNFVKPIERDKNEIIGDLLRKIIFPFILRRTKQQVAKDLPPKTEIVQYAEMLPKQRMLYDITKEMFRGKILQTIDSEGVDRSRFQILEGLLRLRQICCHPQVFDKTFTGESGKFLLIDECIDEVIEGGHRALVFSQFVEVLSMLKNRFAQKGIRTEMLTGSTKNRSEVVDRFQESSGASVFLISLKAGGVGLNLTAADYVIHVDPWWNPAAEAQASDRAYRIGQTRNVFVYKMITKDSIEERVLELQRYKKDLASSVIQSEDAFFKHLDRSDIENLFS